MADIDAEHAKFKQEKLPALQQTNQQKLDAAKPDLQRFQTPATQQPAQQPKVENQPKR